MRTSKIKTGETVAFQPTSSSPGSRVAGACPGSSGHKAGSHRARDAPPSQGPSRTGTAQTRQCTPHAHLWGRRGNGECPEKAHADMQKAGNLYPDRGPAGTDCLPSSGS